MQRGSMWPLSLNAGDASRRTWSTPLTQHIATNETKRRLRIRFSGAQKKIVICTFFLPPPHLSVRLGRDGCAFRRLLHGGFLFSSVLGDLRSHAFFAGLQQRKTQTDQVIEQRPQAPCPEKKISSRAAPKIEKCEQKKCGRDAQRFLPIIIILIIFLPPLEPSL